MGRKPKERRAPYGAWLQHLRKEKGLSQDEMSEKTGVPQSTWGLLGKDWKICWTRNHHQNGKGFGCFG